MKILEFFKKAFTENIPLKLAALALTAAVVIILNAL